MSITKTDLRRVLKTQITPWLAEHGFVAINPDQYERVEEEVEHRIGFSARKRPDELIIEIGSGVRYPAIAHLIALGKEPHKVAGSFGGLLHLIADADSIEWRCSSEKHLLVMAREAKKMIEDYALPFLEEYADIRNLITRLQSPDSKDWLSHEERAELLAGALWHTGAREESLRVLDTYLAENRHRMRKYWEHLQEIRDYLSAMDIGSGRDM